MPGLVESFAPMLRVELKHNPLAMHPKALDAAAASRAAQRQGRFWEYHDLLLAPGPRDRATLLAHARTLGLDEAAFLKDLDDPDLRRGILAEQEEARRAGAEGTPGFLINGHAEVGWASLPWIQGIVRAHLKKQ
jgi:protein-disulfide isomerase